MRFPNVLTERGNFKNFKIELVGQILTNRCPLAASVIDSTKVAALIFSNSPRLKRLKEDLGVRKAVLTFRAGVLHSSNDGLLSSDACWWLPVKVAQMDVACLPEQEEHDSFPRLFLARCPLLVHQKHRLSWDNLVFFSSNGRSPVQVAVV